jgi:hypothetical protein
VQRLKMRKTVFSWMQTWSQLSVRNKVPSSSNLSKARRYPNNLSHRPRKSRKELSLRHGVIAMKTWMRVSLSLKLLYLSSHL